MLELEDRKWFPEFLRRHQMEYLAYLSERFRIYQPVRAMLLNALTQNQNTEWTDACSGSGGPIAGLKLPFEVLLTDLYPPLQSLKLNPNITYYQLSVNLETTLPPGDGLISLFNSFHHFSDSTKLDIIKRTKEANRPLFIVEILQPTFRHFMAVLFSTTVGHWLSVPFIKPFSFRRIIFTYLIPLHTITICIDGIISVFKSKSAGFYNQLSNQITSKHYQVQLLQTKGISGTILIIKGTPKL